MEKEKVIDRERELEGQAAGDWRPRPDPTVLTTQQLYREITALEKFFTSRFDSMDKAVTLLQASSNRSPTINEVYLQLTEKFESIKTQFSERDTRTDQTARDSKVAIDAALKSQQEAFSEQNKSSALAIAKSEASTTKQMDQINTTIQTMAKGVDDKINDLKERITVIESRSQGQQIQRQEGKDTWGYIVGGIGIIISVATLIVFIVINMNKH